MNKLQRKISRYIAPLMIVLLVGGLVEFTLFSKTASALPYSCSAQSPTVGVNEDIVFNASGDDAGSGINGFYWSSGGSPGVGTGWSYTTRFATPGNKTVYVSTSSDSFTVNCSVQVLAGGPLGEAILTANPMSVNAGQSTVITWTCTSALFSLVRAVDPYSVTPLGGDWYPSEDGSAPTIPTQTTTYKLTCYENDDGNLYTEATVTVTVNSAPPPGGPSGDIDCVNSQGFETDGPCVFIAGQSTTLNWDASNTDDCEVIKSGGIGGTVIATGVSGSVSTGALVSSSTYQLNCLGLLGIGQLVDTVTVNVISANLQVSTNTSNNNGPWSDGPLTLPATGVQVRLKATCGATGGSGRISPSNTNFAGTSHYVNVLFNTSPKTWTLSCYPYPNQLGTPVATDSVTVQLNTPNFTLNCTTLSKSVAAGQSTVFDTSLTYSNGFNSQVSISITSGLPAGATATGTTVTPPATVGSIPVQTAITTPQGTSVLTFTATGGGQSDTCTSQLTVTPPEGTPELDHIDLTPEESTIDVGNIQDYDTNAVYTDGTIVDVTFNPSTRYGASDKTVAEMLGNVASGNADGTTTITAEYSEGVITVGDTAILHVGADDGVTASIYCPEGQTSQKVCNIPNNSSISLGWSSTGADDCSVDPPLVPPASGTSGSASTGSLPGPQSYQYTLTCTGGGKGISATDVATVIVGGSSSSFVESDKDITHINGKTLAELGLPAPSSCSGGTDSVGNITFKDGDIVTFRICLKNSGSATANGITITDQMTNLTEPAAGFNAQYQGSPITPDYNPTTGTIEFDLPGSIAPDSTGVLTFDAKITKPVGSSSFTLYRFQNRALIETDEGDDHTVTTPLYLFYAGARVPSKEEVAP